MCILNTSQGSVRGKRERRGEGDTIGKKYDRIRRKRWLNFIENLPYGRLCSKHVTSII